MSTGGQVSQRIAQRRAAGLPPFGPEPLPEPPEKTAGIQEEVTYLRSRGFLIHSTTKANMWRVDGQERHRDWILEKAASVRARTIRNAPEPVKLTGEAPVAIVTTVRESASETDTTDRFRGLGVEGVVECLAALVTPAGGVNALAELLGVPKGSLAPALARRQKPTGAMVDALYGPTGSELQPRWLELIAGGPVTVPAVQSDSDQPASQLPSTPQAPAEKAPAVESAQAAGPDAAGLETETAAGDGAAVYTEIADTAGPEVGEALPAPAGFPEPAADEPGAARPGDQEAGEAQDAPASDPAGPEGAVHIEVDWRPFNILAPRKASEPELPHWSRIEDHDLVAILRGKAAGLAAEIGGLKAEAEALEQRARVLRGQADQAERRRGQLLVTIDHFETEEQADG